MHKYTLAAVPTLLFIAACSSSSSNTESTMTTEPTATTDAEYPASFDHRLTSISYDTDNDGTADRVERFEYDANGRIIQKSVAWPDQTADITTYVYSEGDLIEIQSTNGVGKYGYENGRVVSYQYVSNEGESFNENTLFYYDDNGRLSGVIGQNYLYYKEECGSQMDTEPPELNLSYANSNISGINSVDGVFTSTYTFNSDNKLTRAEDKLTCNETPDLTLLQYNSDGRVSVYETTSPFFGIKQEVTYDTNGMIFQVVSTNTNFQNEESDSQNYEPEISTSLYTYNEQGLVTSTDTTSVGGNPELGISPSRMVTFEYESMTCITAITVNPLWSATIERLNLSSSKNDSLLCTFLLE